jgi:hypothetical protein
MVARRESDDAPLALLRRKLQQPVGRPAQLERPASLQAFAFQPDARALDFALDQRRSLDQAGDPPGRFDDVFSDDLRRSD